MRDVKMKTEVLIDTLETNRAEHFELYEKAYDEYEKRVKREFAEVVAALRDHPVDQVDIGAPYRLSRPVNHIKDYDMALAMLRDETRDAVILSNAEYTQYVADDWGWKQQFTASTQMYLAGASDD